MALLCEDLARYGVILIPPSTEKYFELLADIEQRLRKRPRGAPPVGDDELSFISEHHTGADELWHGFFGFGGGRLDEMPPSRTSKPGQRRLFLRSKGYSSAWLLVDRSI